VTQIKSAIDADPDELPAVGRLRNLPRTPYDIRIAYCFVVMEDKLVCGCSDGALLLYNFGITPQEEKMAVLEEEVAAPDSDEDY